MKKMGWQAAHRPRMWPTKENSAYFSTQKQNKIIQSRLQRHIPPTADLSPPKEISSPSTSPPWRPEAAAATNDHTAPPLLRSLLCRADAAAAMTNQSAHGSPIFFPTASKSLSTKIAREFFWPTMVGRHGPSQMSAGKSSPISAATLHRRMRLFYAVLSFLSLYIMSSLVSLNEMAMVLTKLNWIGSKTLTPNAPRKIKKRPRQTLDHPQRLLVYLLNILSELIRGDFSIHILVVMDHFRVYRKLSKLLTHIMLLGEKTCKAYQLP